MKKYVTVLMTMFSVAVLKSQHFVATAIPDSLKENADMVTRLDETEFEVRSVSHAVLHRRRVYTILNEKGDDYATLATSYDKFYSINYVNAELYDAGGRELKRFKKKDMEDHPFDDGSSFVSDARYKQGSLYCHTYPYTVDFEEEDEIDGFTDISDWFPQSSLSTSVEDSKFTIVAPMDYVIRYKMMNSKMIPAITEKGNKRTYSWEIKGLPAREEIPFCPPLTRYFPYLMVGASDIDVAGYKGNVSTWSDFGRFYGTLQKGRDVLPDEVRQKVHMLTSNAGTSREKIAVLYDYLQKNSHYVGIQLGIGGWQTFDANYVAHNKYGDCKALSNFMISLLKEAGIKAYPVIIHGGNDNGDFVSDFTNDPFNHIICCVPLGKDTAWLECTSPYLPPGYLSNFTSNRYGLMVGDGGGDLVHTPVYTLADNREERKILAQLDPDGTLHLQSEANYKAACQDRLFSFINYNSKDEV
jgi:hypothetical protein